MNKPIPALGLTAFHLLSEKHTRELQGLGDEILEAMGVDPKDPAYLVNFDQGVVSGFPEPAVQSLIEAAMGKLHAQRLAEGTDATIPPAPPVAESVAEVPSAVPALPESAPPTEAAA